MSGFCEKCKHGFLLHTKCFVECDKHYEVVFPCHSCKDFELMLNN